MGAGVSTYDGYADWYDENIAPFSLQVTGAIAELVGRGAGRCLDIGCGTGLHVATLRELGWSVVGVDASSDQLRRARTRVGDEVELVEAEATDMPFPAGAFDAALAAFTHTDVDDFPALLREAARVLRPGGKFVFFGVHPCFVGPHARFVSPDEPVQLHPGYRERRHYRSAAGNSPEGLRARVGAVHIPLGELVQALIGSGFTLTAFHELGDGLYPRIIAIRARYDVDRRH